MEVLFRLVGMSGVHKRPPQGDSIVLDLLPGSHVLMAPAPFCVRIPPDGSLEPISDEEAGIDRRPDVFEAMEQQVEEIKRLANLDS